MNENEVNPNEDIEPEVKKIPEEMEPKLPEEFPSPEDMPLEEPMGEEAKN